jgi:hypothetical protein
MGHHSLQAGTQAYETEKSKDSKAHERLLTIQMQGQVPYKKYNLDSFI